jgi:pimeloyl-ACP methyl ester carboxylesterase
MSTSLRGGETRLVPTRLGRLHTRSYGSGPATVLWPSMFVDGRTFAALVPRLPGRRLVVVDGPGLGASEPLRRRSSIVEAADAAQDLLTGADAAALGLDGPVDWVGNAFGGHVGYELARRPGVLRSLAALSAPTEPVPPAMRRQIGLLGPLLRWLGPVGPVRTAILTALLTEASAADPVLRAAVLTSVAAPPRRSLSLALQSFIEDRVDVTHQLAEIVVPCLFVAGDDRGDWTPEAAAAAAARTPTATAVTVPGSRTLLPLEQPELVAHELQRFWSRL